MIRPLLCLAFAAMIALAAGCGPGGDEAKSGPSPQAEGKTFALASEPAGCKDVVYVRKEAKDGDEVVVAGQVGGSTKPFTEGRAAFLLVDESLKPTSGCDTPWDFCEYEKKEVAAARLSVKLVDGEGKTLKTGAREMFGIKELSHVVVKGKVNRDDKDNVIVVATGVYVRPQ